MEQRDVNELTVGYTQRSVPLPGASLAAADHASHAAGSWICFSPHQFPPHRKRHGMRLEAVLVEAGCGLTVMLVAARLGRRVEQRQPGGSCHSPSSHTRRDASCYDNCTSKYRRQSSWMFDATDSRVQTHGNPLTVQTYSFITSSGSRI